MAVRTVEWKRVYSWGKWIEVTEDKVINIRLRDENNLIIWDEGDNEIYVDLQLDDEIRPTDDFPVWVTTGRVIVDNGWDVTWTILIFKTTSGDYVKFLYGDDGKVYIDNGTGSFKQIYLKPEIDDMLRRYLIKWVNKIYDDETVVQIWRWEETQWWDQSSGRWVEIDPKAKVTVHDATTWGWQETILQEGTVQVNDNLWLWDRGATMDFEKIVAQDDVRGERVEYEFYGNNRIATLADVWGTYTAWNGIDITNNSISLDIQSWSAAPSSAPSYIGQTYIDTTNGDFYIATGTTSSNDWRRVTLAPRLRTITFKNRDGTVLETKQVVEWELPEYTWATPTKSYAVGYGVFDWFNVQPVTGDAEYIAQFHWSCQWPCPEWYHIPDADELERLQGLISTIFDAGCGIDTHAVAQYLWMQLDYDFYRWRDADIGTHAEEWWVALFTSYDWVHVGGRSMTKFGYIRPVCDSWVYDLSEYTQIFANGWIWVWRHNTENKLVLVWACDSMVIYGNDLAWMYQWGNNYSFNATERQDSSLSFDASKDVSWVEPSSYSDGHWYTGNGVEYDFWMDRNWNDWYTLWGWTTRNY